MVPTTQDSTKPGRKSKPYQSRLEEAIADIRQRIGETGKLDSVAAFMAAVPPSKSLIRHRDDILTLAGNGYVTIQVVAYLKEVKNLDVCDRTVRKLVNDEYKMSHGVDQDPGRLDFAAKARFALDRYPAKSVSGTATRILKSGPVTKSLESKARVADVASDAAASITTPTMTSISPPAGTVSNVGRPLIDHRKSNREAEAALRQTDAEQGQASLAKFARRNQPESQRRS